MLLSVQVQSILYHIFMGILYGVSYSLLQYINFHLHINLIKIIVEIVFHSIFTCIMFYGLYQINGGITNLYLIIIFMIGIYIFYKYYFEMVQGCYRIVSNILHPIFKRIRCIKKRVKSIFLIPIKKVYLYLKRKKKSQ